MKTWEKIAKKPYNFKSMTETFNDRLNGTKRKHPPPPLERNKSPNDLISVLPDAVIHQIFSFFATRRPRQDQHPLQVLAVNLDHCHPSRLQWSPASQSRHLLLRLPIPCRQCPNPVHLAYGEEVPRHRLQVRWGQLPRAPPMAPLHGRALLGGTSPVADVRATIVVYTATILVLLELVGVPGSRFLLFLVG